MSTYFDAMRARGSSPTPEAAPASTAPPAASTFFQAMRKEVAPAPRTFFGRMAAFANRAGQQASASALMTTPKELNNGAPLPNTGNATANKIADFVGGILGGVVSGGPEVAAGEALARGAARAVRGIPQVAGAIEHLPAIVRGAGHAATAGLGTTLASQATPNAQPITPANVAQNAAMFGGGAAGRAFVGGGGLAESAGQALGASAGQVVAGAPGSGQSFGDYLRHASVPAIANGLAMGGLGHVLGMHAGVPRGDQTAHVAQIATELKNGANAAAAGDSAGVEAAKVRLDRAVSDAKATATTTPAEPQKAADALYNEAIMVVPPEARPVVKPAQAEPMVLPAPKAEAPKPQEVAPPEPAPQPVAPPEPAPVAEPKPTRTPLEEAQIWLDQTTQNLANARASGDHAPVIRRLEQTLRRAQARVQELGGNVQTGSDVQPAQAAQPTEGATVTAGADSSGTPAESQPAARPNEAQQQSAAAQQQPVATPNFAPVATGSGSLAKTERGTTVQTHYALVNASDLTASHTATMQPNPAFPQELQPRDRTRAASEMQVSRIAQSLEPSFLGASPKASEGAPIIGQDGIVESGNARTIALQRAYDRNLPSAATYKDWLTQHAADFGLDPKTVQGMDRPVLVRVRTSDVNRPEFVRQANEQSVAAMSATEQAQSDASKLTSGMLARFVPSETGDLNTRENRGFVRDFMQHVAGPTEAGRYMTKDGTLSQEGLNRVRNAVFAKAYGDPSALEKLAESNDNNVRNITGAMLNAAPKLTDVKDQIDNGQLYPLDITPDIAQAANKLSQLRDQGTSVEDYLKQGALFGSDVTPLAKDLLQTFDKYKLSRKKLTEVLQTYADLVQKSGNPAQGALFASAKPSKAELLQAAINAVEKRDAAGTQTSLFQNAAGSGGDVGTAGGRAKSAVQGIAQSPPAPSLPTQAKTEEAAKVLGLGKPSLASYKPTAKPGAKIATPGGPVGIGDMVRTTNKITGRDAAMVAKITDVDPASGRVRVSYWGDSMPDNPGIWVDASKVRPEGTPKAINVGSTAYLNGEPVTVVGAPSKGRLVVKKADGTTQSVGRQWLTTDQGGSVHG